MIILFSWMGIIGYILLGYAIFAKGQEWAYAGAAVFLLFFIIRYHSLNPFAPWTSKKAKNNTNKPASPQQINQSQQPDKSRSTNENVKTPVRLCSNCGAQLQDGLIYCENCGSKYDTNNTANSQQINQSQQPDDSRSTHENAKTTVRHCPNCGAQLQDGLIYCENCGSRVN